MIKTPSFYNEPYFFCSSNHMKLANPRILFGVIGGPIGGHLGKPAIIIECEEPQMRSKSEYIAPAPEKTKAPPGLQKPQQNALKPVNAPPGLQKPQQNAPQKQILNASHQQKSQNAPLQQTPLNRSVYYPMPPVFRPYVYFY
jgi:hypothetical protein